ncbi:hypothetical protein G6O67_008484 [Ophiocordyceps sinensis]|nr:hypothetical protein G6O67_008484 [Ophiocordyceps sinensis]
MQAYTSISVKAIARRDLTQDEAGDSQANWIGRYSHGTLYYYLGGVEGTDFVRTFKLPSPMKLADRLKKKLLGDANAAEWEVLDDDAWKVDEVPNEADTSGVVDLSKDGDGKAAPRAESNGWTKVKHRT